MADEEEVHYGDEPPGVESIFLTGTSPPRSNRPALRNLVLTESFLGPTRCAPRLTPFAPP